MILRALHEVVDKSGGDFESIDMKVAFFDIVMDNIRDLHRYMKRGAQLKSNMDLEFLVHKSNAFQGGQLGQVGSSTTVHASNEITTGSKAIERDFIEVHEQPGLGFFLKNLTY